MAKRRNPDNLDGQSHNLFWTLYVLPGKVLLWFRYISAPKGNVFGTARQARSPIVSFLVATLFWALFLPFMYVAATGAYDQSQTYVEEYE